MTSGAIEGPAGQHGRDAGLDRATLGWIAVAILGLGLFVVTTILVLDRVTFPFDGPLLTSATAYRGDGVIWRVLSESANIPLIVIGVGIVLALFATHRRREALIVAVMLIAITAGSEAVKQLVARPRPEGTDPNIPGVVYSFPSGHVLEALTIFGVIAIHAVRSRIPRPLAWSLVALIVVDVALVGISRLVLAAHYPSDVIASGFGATGALGVYGLLTRDDERATHRHGV